MKLTRPREKKRRERNRWIGKNALYRSQDRLEEKARKPSRYSCTAGVLRP